MKFGEMQYDVPFEKLGSKTGRWDFNFFENFSIKQEGKRLYRLHPEYSYLKDDPQLKSDDDFYRSIVFAYMVRFLYKGIIIKHNKTEPTYTKTSLFLCEKRRFFMARTKKGGKSF